MRRYLHISYKSFEQEAATLPSEWVSKQKAAASLCERFIAPLNSFLNSHNPQSFFCKMSKLSDMLSQQKYDDLYNDKEEIYYMYDEISKIKKEILEISGRMSELIMPVLCSRP